MSIDYRAEIIAALRDEADRLEKGGAISDTVYYTFDDGFEYGHDEDPSLNDDAISAFRDALDPCGGGWDDEAARNNFWGVLVPVRGARITDAEPACSACQSEFYGIVEYGVVTLRTHEDPDLPEWHLCESCAEEASDVGGDA